MFKYNVDGKLSRIMFNYLFISCPLTWVEFLIIKRFRQLCILHVETNTWKQLRFLFNWWQRLILCMGLSSSVSFIYLFFCCWLFSLHHDWQLSIVYYHRHTNKLYLLWRPTGKSECNSNISKWWLWWRRWWCLWKKQIKMYRLISSFSTHFFKLSIKGRFG